MSRLLSDPQKLFKFTNFSFIRGSHVYTKRQLFSWSISINVCIISDKWGLQPIFGETHLVY